MNFINALVENKGEDVYLTIGENSFKLPKEKAAKPELKEYFGKEVIVGLRPECIHDEPMYLSSLSEWVIDAYVEVTEMIGAETYLYLTVGENNVIARVPSRSTAKSGDKISVAFEINHAHLFDKDTEKCIIH